jgi:hypothetical protein
MAGNPQKRKYLILFIGSRLDGMVFTVRHRLAPPVPLPGGRAYNACNRDSLRLDRIGNGEMRFTAM